MSTYVMSDIHGDYDRWRNILDQIKLTKDDKLIINGDVIDRGKYGIKIIQEIMAANDEGKKIVMTLGNHEIMMLENWCNPDDQEINENWMYNGGYPTVQAMAALSEAEQNRIIDFIYSCTVEGNIRLDDGRLFHIVHGFVSDKDPEKDKSSWIYESVWGRPDSRSDNRNIDTSKGQLIIGHTPVTNLYSKVESREMMEDHFRIMHAPFFIDIDCGCGHRYPGCCLACLRLDDMCEFYAT